MPTVRVAAEVFRTALTGRVLGGRRARLVSAQPRITNLNAIAGLMTTGDIRSVVDDTYTLQDAGDALQESRRGHVRGKLVVRVR